VRQARSALADLGAVEPVTDPLGALERLAGEAVALVEVLRQMVSELETVRYRAGAGSGGEQIRGELTAYIAILGRAESILGRIISLDFDGRRLRLDEARAQLISRALQAAIRRAGLPGEFAPSLKEALVVELRAIGDGL